MSREQIPQDLLDAIDTYGLGEEDEDIQGHRRRTVVAKLREFRQAAQQTQAEELAAVKAKMGELEYQLSGIRICLQEIRNDHWTHWPDSDIQKVNKALASTDAPNLREKYYEECAVIAWNHLMDKARKGGVTPAIDTDFTVCQAIRKAAP